MDPNEPSSNSNEVCQDFEVDFSYRKQDGRLLKESLLKGSEAEKDLGAATWGAREELRGDTEQEEWY